ncbi:MAG: PEP-CTERM sorting domain-containing protein [Planctomycetota bacterium]
MATATNRSRRFSPASLATVALAAGGETALAAVLFDAPYGVTPPANGTYTATTSGTVAFGAWSAVFDNASGGRTRTVNTSAAPNSLQLGLSTNTNLTMIPDAFEFTAVVPAGAPAGLVSFGYNYSEFDPFGDTSFSYTKNGTVQPIALATGTSTFSFSVNPGDIFGFVLSSAYFGANASVTITNFDAPVVPEPSALLLLATGFGGVLGLRYRRRLTG